jgi:hypothetical protein
MKQACFSLALVLGLAVPAGLCAEELAPAQTVGDFVTRMPHEDTEPFIQYCKATLPELEMVLSLEYEHYNSRLEEARFAFRRKMAKRAYMDQPMPLDVATDLQRQTARRLADAKAEDPVDYCTTLREHMASRTVDLLTKQLEGIFVRLETLNNLNVQLKRYGVKPPP